MTAIIRQPSQKLVGAGVGQPGWLDALVEYDRKLAACVLSGHVGLGQVPRVKGIEVATGLSGWTIINLSACFESTEAEKTVDLEACALPCVDSWIFDVRYTVRRPNWLPGSALKAQSDYYNALNPNIDVALTITSYQHYTVSADETPLENFAQRFECQCPGGIILAFGCQGIDGEVTNGRTLQSTETPLEVVISLHAIMLGRSYGALREDDREQILTAAGFGR